MPASNDVVVTVLFKRGHEDQAAYSIVRYLKGLLSSIADFQSDRAVITIDRPSGEQLVRWLQQQPFAENVRLEDR